MRVKLSINELNYLTNNFFKERLDLKISLVENKTVCIDDDIGEQIREWALEKLQIIGFDENYQLTKEGELLENIIDKFYQ